MSANDPIAACDRLTELFQRASALDHARRLTTDDSVHAPIVPFVIAQLRMRLIPALSPSWDADPVHVVLFGGTNTGKSTVLNLLLGRDVAGMSVLARFSQYPEAYQSQRTNGRWLDAFPSRFRDYERFRGERPSRQSDDQLTRNGFVPRLAVFDRAGGLENAANDSLADAVLWDGPDFSTEAAQAYLGTVLDLAALADIVVVTVTSEAYADHRGHALLRMLGESGVALHVAANKLLPGSSLLDDIAPTLAASAGIRAPIHRLGTVPGANPSERLAHLLQTPEAASLRAAVGREAARGRALKAANVRGAVALVDRHWEAMLRPIEEAIRQADRWSHAVARLTRERVLEPYRRGYLDGVQFGEFNRTLAAVSRLLRVPWIGPVLETAGMLVRWPFRAAKALVRRVAGAAARSPAEPPEHAILAAAIDNWLAAVKAEAQALASSSDGAAGAELVAQLERPDFRAAIVGGFDVAFAEYRKEVDEVVRRRAEAIYQKLRERPRRLNVLRSANLLGNAMTVAVVVKSGGFDWSDAVAGPVVAGLWQNLLEWGLGRYLETHRAGLKQDQFNALERLAETHLTAPARDALKGAIAADALDAARHDFRCVKDAINRALDRSAT
jgi:hypothetical protein